ncbi:MAG: alpha/beta hydrolase [Tepidisphaeraceae bacterium]
MNWYRFASVVALTIGLSFTSVVSAQARPSGESETIRGINYRESEANLDQYALDTCKLDLIHPPTRGYATVVWFHGGGLTGGEKEIPAALRGHDFAVAGVGYRLSPHVKSPVYIEDAAAAVAWTIKHIDQYGGDPQRVYLSGHSAGAYLALMIALDKHWLADRGVDADQLAGVISISAQAITHFTIRAERGIPNERTVIDEFAPVFHVRKDAPPLLLLTGDREQELLGRYEENAYLWRMLKLVGHPRVELKEIQGFDHGGVVGPGLDLLVKRLAADAKAKPSPTTAPATRPTNP